jgi:hypothetical protein
MKNSTKQLDKKKHVPYLKSALDCEYALKMHK